MAKVKDLFKIQYGNSLVLNDMTQAEKGVAFVSRTSKNNGVSAIVEPVNTITPFPAGLITVALSSMSVLETNVQPYPFYTGYHVAVLTPLKDMTINEKIYYCLCIKKNKYRYYFGRQANRTLGELEIPNDAPSWINSIDLDALNNLDAKLLEIDTPELNVSEWENFTLSQLFEIKTGKGPLIREAKKNPGSVPVVSSTQFKNGIVAYTDVDITDTHPSNTLTLAKNGSVGEVFYQSNNFVATSDVLVLEPKFDFNVYISMFIIPLIKKHRHKYNYGRKWNKEDLEQTSIPLPTKDNKPDFMYMENYIKTLKYSKSL